MDTTSRFDQIILAELFLIFPLCLTVVWRQLLLSLYRYVYIIENFILSVTIYPSEVNCTRSCVSRKIYVLFCAYLFFTLYMNSSLLVRLENGRKSLLQIKQNQCACKVLSLMQLPIARIV